MGRYLVLLGFAGFVVGCDDGTGFLPQLYPTCGGLFAATCADGLVCADTPADGCSAYDGGADCGGICVTCDDPGVNRTVVFDNPRDCGAMDFDCDQGEVQWSDDCGCGCQKP